MLKNTFNGLKEFFKAFALEDSEKANEITFTDMSEDNEIPDDGEGDSNGKQNA